MRVIVGLGNPGPRYARTRHNLGVRCVDRLARQVGATFRRRKQLLVVDVWLAGQPVILSKLRTFMNLSGEAVYYLAGHFCADLADLIVICDDMDLPPGKIRLRPEGGSGGHKGLESIIAHLGTEEFPRIRIGIGHPVENNAVSHVLGSLTREETAAIDDAVDRAAQAVVVILTEGLDVAMNRFN